MEKINENINRFLPYGESLRLILQHPSLTKADIRHLLRLKGIFIDDLEDETTFPLLITCLLSPYEFDAIKERLQSREDREKTITRTLDWDSSVTLIGAIPEHFNIQEIVKTAFPKYKVVGNPNFRMIGNDPNKVMLDFKCESENYSKEWYRANHEFRGQVSLERIVDRNNKVQLQIVHTSPETTEISDKVVKTLERHFKANNYMNPQNSIQRILYKDFTNEERIEFFLSLTEGDDVFDFQRASYLDIGPDQTMSLPEGINWLELAKVRELNINGEVLHNIHFIKEVELHKYMELAEMEIIYNFSIPAAEGNCRIKFGFPGYFSRRISNIEFVVDVVKINVKDEFSSVPQSSIRNSLLKAFEKLKSEKHDWIKLKTLNKQYTPDI
jgi:hypothetical protein